MITKVDCLIPYYNEGDRLNSVVDTALQCSNVNNVICVNDGSTIISTLPQHPRLIQLKHHQNQGKSSAIRTGLTRVKTEYVFLIDADLIGLNPDMIRNCIKYVLKNRPDMLVIRRINTLRLTKLLRMDLLEAGERILKSSDLTQILSSPISQYELEPAINMHFISRQLNVIQTTLPFQQYRKINKVGFFRGIAGDYKALRQVLNYAGWRGIIHLIKHFNPTQIDL